MPGFFAAENAGIPIDARVRIFKERILYPYPELYDEGYFTVDDPHVAWYLSRLLPKVLAIRQFETALERSLPSYESAFESAFPNFQQNTITIYLMPSLAVFDGMTRDVQGKHALLIGIDNFAQEDLPMGVFIDHEMFHIYHHEINPQFFPTSSENDLYEYGLYRQLWAEGLATYVSAKLNPTASKAEVLASADLANLQPSGTRYLACNMEAALDSTDAAESALFFDEDRHPKGLPSRGGYYIGYLVASQLGKSSTLAQLDGLNGERLENDIRAAVHSLCIGRGN